MEKWLIVFSLTFISYISLVNSGCVDLGRCCRGQDSGCRALGTRQTPSNATSCFCDEHCHKAGDCCDDIGSACPPQDCEVGDFGEWGDCSETCGWGYMKRSRPVIREGVNGGAKCDKTSQKTYCMGVKCKGKRTSVGFRELRETAKIVPAEFGAWRKDKLYNPYTDIRKNLFYHYKKENRIGRPSYCAKFTIDENRRACTASPKYPWAASLEVGATVCVECQPSAMKKHLGVRCKGHGVYMSKTRWNAATVADCHGKWSLVNKHEEGCSCDPNSPNSFIFI